MALTTVTSLLTDRFISALCNTLVHSLWQGIVLAAITGLIIIFTRKASAAMRYNLLITALVVFAIGVGITFATQFKVDDTVLTTPTVEATVNQSLNFVTEAVPTVDLAAERIGFSYILKSYLKDNQNTIVLIWFLIICAKSIQLGFGLWSVKRIKQSQIAVAAYWTERLQYLADSLAVKQSVAMFESALAKVPMVIGNLKPVILMPIGLLTALSTDEIEAILVHELAHIKRRDYLVNLLQSLMEIVFFFNPAVLWVSQLIKTERENCCDDLAITQSSSKVNYIRALVSCQEYRAAVPAYAVAFPGSKNSLVDRVKRIAANRNHSLNLFEKTALALCLVISGVVFTAFTEKERINVIADKIVAVLDNIKNEQTTQPDIDNELAPIAKENKQHAVKDHSEKDVPVIDDLVDSLDLVATDIPLSGTAGLSFGDNAHLDMLSACLPPLGVQLAALGNKKGTADSSKYLYKYDAKYKEWRDYKQSTEYTDTYRIDTNKKAKPAPTPNAKASAIVISDLKLDARVNFKTNTDFKTDAKANITTDSNGRYLNLTKNGKSMVLNNHSALDTSKHLAALSNIKVNLHLPKIADLLFDAGVIKDKANFSAFLNNTTLIVNGQPQPEKIHQQILKKYQRKPDDPVNLSFTYGNPPGRIVPVK